MALKALQRACFNHSWFVMVMLPSLLDETERGGGQTRFLWLTGSTGLARLAHWDRWVAELLSLKLVVCRRLVSLSQPHVAAITAAIYKKVVNNF